MGRCRGAMACSRRTRSSRGRTCRPWPRLTTSPRKSVCCRVITMSQISLPERYLSQPKTQVETITRFQGISADAISGIIVAVTVALLLGICLYICLQRRKNSKVALFPSAAEAEVSRYSKGVTSRVVSSPFTGITIDRSVKFSYEELASATNDFGMTNKIGEGGFGLVYYAELRGEKAAIKKMDMQATNEFLAELKVLTNVHHLNLVRLIGYCTEVSLFLVYEFIENGNLSEHLRGLGRDPLPWLTRIQIALHSAKGLEYIHEYTNPVYIHRDIKSSNILIDKNFCLRKSLANLVETKN